MSGFRPTFSIKMNTKNNTEYSTTPVDKIAYWIKSSLIPAFLNMEDE